MGLAAFFFLAYNDPLALGLGSENWHPNHTFSLEDIDFQGVYRSHFRAIGPHVVGDVPPKKVAARSHFL